MALQSIGAISFFGASPESGLAGLLALKSATQNTFGVSRNFVGRAYFRQQNDSKPFRFEIETKLKGKLNTLESTVQKLNEPEITQKEGSSLDAILKSFGNLRSLAQVAIEEPGERLRLQDAAEIILEDTTQAILGAAGQTQELLSFQAITHLLASAESPLEVSEQNKPRRSGPLSHNSTRFAFDLIDNPQGVLDLIMQATKDLQALKSRGTLVSRRFPSFYFDVS